MSSFCKLLWTKIGAKCIFCLVAPLAALAADKLAYLKKVKGKLLLAATGAGLMNSSGWAKRLSQGVD